jgi:hypothetical protein
MRELKNRLEKKRIRKDLRDYKKSLRLKKKKKPTEKSIDD